MENRPAQQQHVDHVGGFIVFRDRENGEGQEYLLLKKRLEDDWSPPKGKRDNKWETEIETAIRETREETGLIEVKDYQQLSPRIYFEYTNSTNILKKVSLWPARLYSCSKVIRLSREHDEFRWFKMDEAVAIIKTEYKSALERAIASIK